MHRFLKKFFFSHCIIWLLAAGATPASGSESQVARVAACGKSMCLRGTYKTSVTVALLEAGKDRYCKAMTGKSFKYIRKQGTESEEDEGESFPATELNDLKSCDSLHPQIALLNASIKKMAEVKPQTVTPQDREKLANLAKTKKLVEVVINDDLKTSLMYENSYDPLKFSLDDVKVYRAEDTAVQVMNFSNKNVPYRSGLLIFEINGKFIPETHTCGGSTGNPLQIDSNLYFISESNCCECDAWHLMEVYRVNRGEIKKVYSGE